MSPHRCSLLFNRSWQVRQTTRGLHSNGWAGEYSSMRVRKNLLRDKVKVAQCSPISEHIHLKRYILGDVFSLLLVQSRFFSRKSEAPLKNKAFWKFPGSPVVRTRGFTAKGPGSIPGWGTKISQTGQHGQKKKKKKSLDICQKQYFWIFLFLPVNLSSFKTRMERTYISISFPLLICWQSLHDSLIFSHPVSPALFTWICYCLQSLLPVLSSFIFLHPHAHLP